MRTVPVLLIILLGLFLSADKRSISYYMKPNHLINSTSPYLLQHAYNPVEWHEWGDEALGKAKAEDKPILVSIGYSSCHWCHVMERESFENEEIASLMNKNFVCIKVDREERPDIDQIYMEAVQAMGINGGWPLNVFATPDQKPFYGGTYFPPANWSQLLRQIAKLYQEKRAEISANAEQLADHIAKSDLASFRTDPEKVGLKLDNLDTIYQLLSKNFDVVWGGHDRAPKFIMPAQWSYLLRYAKLTGNKTSLDHTLFTLDKIAQGGIYDQVAGGFARYSVDEKWFAPHFEKMLYDNAQLLSLYSEAYKISKKESYRVVLQETVDWLKREMTNDRGGFYSALDADSEGEEGKYYVWTKQELEPLIPEKLRWVFDYYSVADSGNWEHGNNILFVQQSKADFINEHSLNERQFDDGLAEVKQRLLKARGERIRPGLDDKVIAGWNAMTIIGLLDAYTALGGPEVLHLALQNMRFIESNLISDGRLHRSWKGRRSGNEGFLEDYAYLIAAYLKLYQVTFDESYLSKAQQWLDYTDQHFFDEKESFYFYASSKAEQLIARKKEVFDNVIPSSNAVMARNSYHIGIILDETRYRSRGIAMTKSLANVLLKEPAYASYWATNYAEMCVNMAEVVMVGEKAKEVNAEMQKRFLPFALFMGTTTQSTLPLLQEKASPRHPATIFVCYNKTCKLPVHTVEEAIAQMKTK
ncbi:MAG: thioredoxin domain-containing protein [Cyclobacteriaceae bacterium]